MSSIPSWPLPSSLARAERELPAAAPDAASDSVAARWGDGTDLTRLWPDPASQELLRTVAQVAPSDAGVLLLGDGGADKEWVARHIHATSMRRNGPFVTVNCGALSESLIHTELFGHVQGAFAGAFDNMPGRLEEAHLGTLFLDEVDDLPLPVQSKLVRALQEQVVSRLGSQQRIPVDVRVLAASRQSLEKAVAARRFREDLYYLLGVVRLPVLPLRQRPGDIVPLAEHFIRTWCQRMHYAPVELSAPAKEKLQTHDWPGNSRELENVMQRTLLLSQSLHIQAEEVSLTEAPVTVAAATGTDVLDVQSQAQASADVALDEALEGLCDGYEQALEAHVLNALLLKVWRRNRFNQVHTAKQLGISRSVVRARLQRLGQLNPLTELAPHPQARSVATREDEGVHRSDEAQA